jgi:hypothetical protein
MKPIPARLLTSWLLALTMTVLFLAPARAVKGKPVREAAGRPEAVLITLSGTNRMSECSGVLIAGDVVLTAGHAVLGFHEGRVSAPYARNGRNGDKRLVSFACNQVIVHPEFQKTRLLENDLAILLLQKKVDLPGPFPTLHDGDLLRLESPLIVVGRTNQGKMSAAGLFEASTTLVAWPGNVNVYGGNPNVSEPGDSGGPVFAASKPHEIVGLVSAGLGRNRFVVATDCYVPLSRKNRAWVMKHLTK